MPDVLSDHLSGAPTMMRDGEERWWVEQVAYDRLRAENERLRKFAESAAAAFHDLDYERGYLHAKAVLAGAVDEEDSTHA